MDQFSSDFASHWDELVGWEKRAEADTTFLLNLIRRFKCQSVLDVALGTGFHSIKLLQAGIKVKSVDLSLAMIDVAKRNGAAYGVELDVVCADWIDLTKKISEKFDCVICLGNSLACEMDALKRQQAVSNWAEMLSDNGIIVVDRRNYEAMLAGHYNRRSKGQYFGESVQITFSKLTPEETLFSYTFSDGRTFDLQMYPIMDHQMRSLFLNEGLKPAEVYGDRQLNQSGDDVGFYLYVFKKVMNA